jgi:hypothetical protein
MKPLITLYMYTSPRGSGGGPIPGEDYLYGMFMIISAVV